MQYMTFRADDLAYFVKDLKRKWLPAIVKVMIAYLCAVIASNAFNYPFVQYLDLIVQRGMYELRGPREPDERVILVAVDDESYQTLQAPTSFPLPRMFIAQALEKIADASPKIAIIDGRIEPQPNIAPEADKRIEAVMKRMPTTIWSGREVENREDPTTKIVMPSDNRFRNVALSELSMAVGVIMNTPCFVALRHDEDESENERLELLNLINKVIGLKDSSPPGPYDYINFYGPHLTMPRIALSRVLALSTNEARQMFSNKIVVLGYQSRNYAKGPGNSDRFSVPVSSGPMYGVEIHATILSNILQHSWLKRFSPQSEFLLIGCIVFILVSYALWFTNWKSLAVIVIGVCGYIGTAYFLFSQSDFWVAGVGIVSLVAMITVVISGFYFILARDRFERLAEKKLGFRIDQR